MKKYSILDLTYLYVININISYTHFNQFQVVQNQNYISHVVKFFLISSYTFEAALLMREEKTSINNTNINNINNNTNTLMIIYLKVFFSKIEYISQKSIYSLFLYLSYNNNFL
jgi:hypothetical protein